jgi:hypothetical protein
MHPDILRLRPRIARAPPRSLNGIALFGGRHVARYAVNASDVVSAAKRLAAATNEPFECRSSD